MRTLAKVLIVLLGVLLIALVGGLWFLQSAPAKDYVASWLSDRIGRELVIAGDVDIDWSLTPQVRVEQVRLANAVWGSAPQMLEIPVLMFRIRLAELAAGEVYLPAVELVRPRIVLERNERGVANWTFAQDSGNGAAQFPEIGRLRIEDGAFRYHDEAQAISLHGTVHTTQEPGSPGAGLHVKAQGRMAGQPVAVAADVEAPQDVLLLDKALALTATAELGKTALRLEGTVADPLALQGLDLRLHAQGQDLAALRRIIDISLPVVPPFRIAGHLTHDGAVWAFQDIEGRIKDTDFSGDLTLNTAGRIPVLRGTIAMKKFNLAEVIGDADTGREATVTSGVIPEVPITIGGLDGIRAAVALRAEQVTVPYLSLSGVRAEIRIEEGQLSLTPLTVGVANGEVTGALTTEESKARTVVVANLNLDALMLGSLLPDTELLDGTTGRLNGRIDLRGSGDSLDTVLANSNGRIVLFVTDGTLDRDFLEALDVRVTDILGLSQQAGGSSKVLCAVALLPVKDGIMTIKTLVVDARRGRIVGDGRINLADETLDIVLVAESPERGLGVPRIPIQIQGALANPNITAKTAGALARAGAAAALGVLASPLAAILPLLDLEEESQGQCKQALREVRREAQQQQEGNIE